MCIIRSRFYKKEDMIFISHLDLIRVFERTMRRANIPMAYTQGFNPHPIMSFATALGVGVSSDAEYIDIRLDQKISLEVFMDRLNQALPQGLKIIRSQYIDKDEKSLMAIVDASIYLVEIDLFENIEKQVIESKIQSFLELEEILEIKEKKQKKGKGYRGKSKVQIQKNNIREGIIEMELLKKHGNKIVIKCMLITGSKGNLRPEIVIFKLKELSDLPMNIDSLRVHREELLKKQGEKYLRLLENFI